MGNTFLNCW